MQLSLPRLLVPFLAAVAALIAVAPAASAQAAGVAERSIGADAARSAEDFWTAERLREATPRPLPTQPGDVDFDAPAPKPRALPASPALSLGDTIAPRAPRGGGKIKIGDRPPYESGEVPVALQTTYPTSTNGRIFGKLRGLGLYSCSGTVVTSSSQSVVFTAGHCVHDLRIGFAEKVIFVPAYHRGKKPFGVWSASKLVATKGWQRIENYNYDYAAIRLRKSGGETVGSVVGELGVAFNQPREQTFQAIGYPFNKEKAKIMWNCVSKFAGVDPRDRTSGKPDNGIGCDMSEGASGGGWFIRDAAGGLYLNSVTSFGYEALKKVLFGPYLDRKVLKVIDAANN